MDEDLLQKMDAALAEICPMPVQAFTPAVGIERQLLWCRDFVRNNEWRADALLPHRWKSIAPYDLARLQ